jgi:hypothetical protein
MRRKTQPLRRQVMLFPILVRGDVVPVEARDEVVGALADLLLEALDVRTNLEGGGDEPEGDG